MSVERILGDIYIHSGRIHAYICTYIYVCSYYSSTYPTKTLLTLVSASSRKQCCQVGRFIATWPIFFQDFYCRNFKNRTVLFGRFLNWLLFDVFFLCCRTIIIFLSWKILLSLWVTPWRISCEILTSFRWHCYLLYREIFWWIFYCKIISVCSKKNIKILTGWFWAIHFWNVGALFKKIWQHWL